MLPETITQLPTWKIQVFRLHDEDCQQRVLAALERIKRTGLVYTGARSGSGCFVIVECSSLLTEIRARRIMSTIDPSVTLAHECRSPQPKAVGHR